MKGNFISRSYDPIEGLPGKVRRLYTGTCFCSFSQPTKMTARWLSQRHKPTRMERQGRGGDRSKILKGGNRWGSKWLTKPPENRIWSQQWESWSLPQFIPQSVQAAWAGGEWGSRKGSGERLKTGPLLWEPVKKLTPVLLPTLQLDHWWDPVKPGRLKQRTSGVTESRAYSTEQRLRKPLYLHPQTRRPCLSVSKPESHPEKGDQKFPLRSLTSLIKQSVLTFPGGASGKEPAFQCRRFKRRVGWGQVSIPGLGRPPGGGHGNPLQYSYLEKWHRQRCLVGYSPQGCKESDMTEKT